MSEQATPDGQAVISMERVYIKDISYEAPTTPHVFLESKTPEINIQLNISHRPLNVDDGLYELVLAVTVEARAEDSTIFLIEVQQAAVFVIRGIPEQELGRVLEIACPAHLFPFAREAINDLVCRGGFPQLLINPVNFEALYEQHQESSAEEGPIQH